jgi:transcriptional regulator with XRE-family HTH domain
MSTETFAARLRLGMLISGVKSNQLAKVTGMSESNISHFLSGSREPNVENLAKLLRALPGIDARFLICGGEKP